MIDTILTVAANNPMVTVPAIVGAAISWVLFN